MPQSGVTNFQQECDLILSRMEPEQQYSFTQLYGLVIGEMELSRVREVVWDLIDRNVLILHKNWEVERSDP